MPAQSIGTPTTPRAGGHHLAAARLDLDQAYTGWTSGHCVVREMVTPPLPWWFESTPPPYTPREETHMDEFYPGQVLHDRADIDRLPVGSVIGWDENDEEEIGIIRAHDDGERWVDNTQCYYIGQSYIVNVPFSIIRLGGTTKC